MPISTGLNSHRIRVGIILAEDRQTSVSASWDPGQLLDGSENLVDGAHSLEISVVNGALRLGDGDAGKVMDRLALRVADDVQVLRPGHGVTLDPVRTGRGFHWQKNIRVTLPGELIFGVRNGFLEVVNHVDVESYVACVATSEMGAAAPAELLAAQTVVARCWALALVEKKHLSEGFDVCNDDCCQRYQGTTFISPRSIEAARNTAGQVLVYSDQVIDARYSKNCGGVVEDYASVWGGESVPYLVPLWDSPVLGPRPAHFGTFEDYFEFTDAFCAPPRFAGVDLQSMLGKVDVSGTYYRWHHEVMAGTITCNLRQYEDVDWIAVEGVEILHRGASARITAISLKGVDHTGSRAEHTVLSEYSIRRVFSDSFLYSSAFEILNAETFREDGVLRLRGCGWGHGVGLCQMGALGMALSGYAAKEILEHYYPGAALRTLDAVLGTN